MKPLLRANNKSGFTLVELMVAATVTGLVLTSICSVYYFISSEWTHQQQEADSLVATSLACSRLADYVSQAVTAQTYMRQYENDTLIITLPRDTANGIYVPTWSGGKMQYGSGTTIAFYLSDNTGSFYRTGSILWAATMVQSGYYSYYIYPDSSWSLYPDTNVGKIAPLKSIRFLVVDPGNRKRVILTAVSAYKVEGVEKQLEVNRTVCLRNSE